MLNLLPFVLFIRIHVEAQTTTKSPAVNGVINKKILWSDYLTLGIVICIALVIMVFVAFQCRNNSVRPDPTTSVTKERVNQRHDEKMKSEEKYDIDHENVGEQKSDEVAMDSLEKQK